MTRNERKTMIELTHIVSEILVVMKRMETRLANLEDDLIDRYRNAAPEVYNENDW